MSNRRISELPVDFLAWARARAEKNAADTLKGWGNPTLSDQDRDTLYLMSLILVTTSAWTTEKYLKDTKALGDGI